jgi:hypothetical protein
MLDFELSDGVNRIDIPGPGRGAVWLVRS